MLRVTRNWSNVLNNVDLFPLTQPIMLTDVCDLYDSTNKIRGFRQPSLQMPWNAHESKAALLET